MTRCKIVVATLLVGSGILSAPGYRAPRHQVQLAASQAPPAVSLAPSLVGAYRKLIEIEDDLSDASVRYGIDLGLVRALCLASPRLDLAAAKNRTEGCLAAHGRGGSPLDAGMRDLATLTRQFPRQDYAVAAYYAGAASVGRVQPTDLETLHLVAEIAHYRDTLRLHETSVRREASQLQLAHPVPTDDWESLAERLGVSLSHLRLHNPFAAGHGLRADIVVAYRPGGSDPGSLRATDALLEYEARIGDTCTALAALLMMPVQTIRSLGAWCAGGLPAGLVIQVPGRPEPDYRWVGVRPGDTTYSLARTHGVDPWQLSRANGLLPAGEPLTRSLVWIPRSTPAGFAVAPEPKQYTVIDGDTLSAIAKRHDTTVRAIQTTNAMGQRTLLRVGERLILPPREAEGPLVGGQ